MSESMGTVLIVDDDADISALVEDLLRDEGYAVTILRDRSVESIQATVKRLRPDCVLLDGEAPGRFGASWDDAAWLTAPALAVPVIMFSADQHAVREARANESARSRAAGFSAIVEKPFELDEMVRVVALASRRSQSEPSAHALPGISPTGRWHR